MNREVRAAAAALGHPIAIDQLESTLPGYGKVLPSGLADNPLQPGVAGVQAGCPNEPSRQSTLDWVYCAETGEFKANLP